MQDRLLEAIVAVTDGASKCARRLFAHQRPAP